MLKNIWSVLKVAIARLRFLAVFVVAALIVGYWDTIQNYVDKWTRPASAEVAQASDVEYYCTMHPNVIRSEPGNCPICSMPLAKRKKGEKAVLPEGVAARVQLTPQRMALAGVATSTIESRDLVREIRAIATLDYDETRVAQLAARVAGRADELYVKSVGQMVKRGDKVYSLYSPELYTAQREYLLARKRVNDLPKDAAEELRHDAIEIYNATMQKLVLWGATQGDFERLDTEFDKTGKVPTHFVVTSPISGIVAKKTIFEGGYIAAGEAPFTIVDLSNLWLQVRVFEIDAPLVKIGEPVQIQVEGLPNETLTGKITFLAYQLDPATRTLAARVELPNTSMRLKPGMFAEARIRVAVLPEAAAQPTTAPTAESVQAAAFFEALQPYFAAQKPLVDDKTAGVLTALREMSMKLEKFKGNAEIAPPLEAIGKLVPAAEKVEGDIKKLRDVYREISAEMIAIGKAVGVPADAGGGTVRIFRCPMGKKPDWLQIGAEAINPYMGQRMVNCGGPIDALPKRAAAIATRPVTRGSKLPAVPRSAVIDTGSRKIVFVADGQIEGAFNMKAIKVGPLAEAVDKEGKLVGEFYPVLQGLEPGERVVTAGAFLLDAENRLNGN